MADVRYNTNDLSYDPERKLFIKTGVDIFPAVVELKSSKTGRVVTYVQDTEKAVEHEFWDGELMEYKAEDSEIVARLMITH